MPLSFFIRFLGCVAAQIMTHFFDSRFSVPTYPSYRWPSLHGLFVCNDATSYNAPKFDRLLVIQRRAICTCSVDLVQGPVTAVSTPFFLLPFAAGASGCRSHRVCELPFRCAVTNCLDSCSSAAGAGSTRAPLAGLFVVSAARRRPAGDRRRLAKLHTRAHTDGQTPTAGSWRRHAASGGNKRPARRAVTAPARAPLAISRLTVPVVRQIMRN